MHIINGLQEGESNVPSRCPHGCNTDSGQLHVLCPSKRVQQLVLYGRRRGKRRLLLTSPWRWHGGFGELHNGEAVRGLRLLSDVLPDDVLLLRVTVRTYEGGTDGSYVAASGSVALRNRGGARGWAGDRAHVLRRRRESPPVVRRSRVQDAPVPVCQ